MEIEKIKSLLYAVNCEFENEIDSYTSSFKETLSDTDINMLFEFLNHYIDKINLLLDDKERGLEIYEID